MGLFGKKKTPDEEFRMFKHNINSTKRMIEREIRQLSRKEPEIKNKIVRYIKTGEKSAGTVLAGDLVRNRKAIARFRQFEQQLDSVVMRVTQMKAEMGVSNALQRANGIMHSMNNGFSLAELYKIVQQFTQESEMCDMKSSMMDDIMDNDITTDEIDEEMFSATLKLFGELNIPITPELSEMISPTPLIG